MAVALLPPPSHQRDDFSPGENSLVALNETIDLSPAAAAEKAVHFFDQSTEEMIRGCVAVDEGCKRFKGKQLTEFKSIIARCKKIPTNEIGARGEVAGSTLSKMMGIAQDATWLLGLADCLRSSVSLLYAVRNWGLALSPHPAERVSILRKRISELDAPVQRKWVEDQHKALKAARRTADKPSNPADEGREAETQREESLSLLFGEPTDADLRRIGRDDAAPDEVVKSLSVCDALQPDSTAMILVKVRDLATITSKFLPALGFKVQRVLLESHPPNCDITDSRLLIVASRGAGADIHMPEGGWFTPEVLTRPDVMAAELLGRDDPGLHLFANSDTPGWKSVTSKQVWQAAEADA